MIRFASMLGVPGGAAAMRVGTEVTVRSRALLAASGEESADETESKALESSEPSATGISTRMITLAGVTVMVAPCSMTAELRPERLTRRLRISALRCSPDGPLKNSIDSLALTLTTNRKSA